MVHQGQEKLLLLELLLIELMLVLLELLDLNLFKNMLDKVLEWLDKFSKWQEQRKHALFSLIK
jgi:hypothetical protein